MIIFTLFKNTISSFYKHFIIYFPKSSLGEYIRKKYWQKYLNSNYFRLIERGVEIFSTSNSLYGKNLVIGYNTILSCEDGLGIYIGDNVGIAAYCYIRTANHKIQNIDIPILKQGHDFKILTHKDNNYSIVIEDDVWIGANSIILSGSYLSKGVVISAGSVVSSKIPPYSIVAGNPARVIKSRLTQ